MKKKQASKEFEAIPVEEMPRDGQGPWMYQAKVTGPWDVAEKYRYRELNVGAHVVISSLRKLEIGKKLTLSGNSDPSNEHGAVYFAG